MTPALYILRPKVYISGPYSSDPVTCVKNAVIAANRLLDLGFNPLVPHFSHYLHLAQARDYEFWLDLDLEWIALCDALLRLPGESPGADREVAEAERCLVPVFTDVESLRRSFAK